MRSHDTAIPPPTFSALWSLQYAAGGLPFTMALSQRIGAILAWGAGRARLRPTALTVLGAITFVLGAILFVASPPTVWGSLAVVAVLQLGYGFDCADGQLARATQSVSTFGAWLDTATDYFRYLLLAGASIIWIAQNSDLGFPLVIVVGLIYSIGMVISLHTLTALRAQPRKADGNTGPVRLFAGCIVDTVTVLSLLAVLRIWPTALAGYLVLMGVSYAALAAYQAITRIH